MATKFENVRGMRDFLPEDMIIRQKIIEKIKKVFEAYGFAPLETPALEYSKLLGKKYGEEERLIYRFKDKGGRELALKYDLTVPLARVVASNPLSKPFKRYQIQPVWRYDRPQKGRYREFWQCDIDTIGIKSNLADAEIVACAAATLKTIGLKKFTIRINNRKLMNQMLIDAGVAQRLIVPALRAIDKLDKLGEDGVGAELRKKGVSKETIATLLEFIRIKGPLNKIFKAFLVDKEIKKELQEFESYLKSFGVKNYMWDLSLARGLDYYTGPVFEIIGGKGIGSIAGGGRYDNLIGMFAGQSVPATGLSFGLERVAEVLKLEKKKTKVKVYVIPIQTIKQSIKIAEQLRKAGINVDIDLQDRSISKNLGYANKLGIPYVAIIGKKEKKNIRLRDMKTGKEQLMAIKQVIKKLL